MFYLDPSTICAELPILHLFLLRNVLIQRLVYILVQKPLASWAADNWQLQYHSREFLKEAAKSSGMCLHGQRCVLIER